MLLFDIIAKKISNLAQKGVECFYNLLPAFIMHLEYGAKDHVRQ